MKAFFLRYWKIFRWWGIVIFVFVFIPTAIELVGSIYLSLAYRTLVVLVSWPYAIFSALVFLVMSISIHRHPRSVNGREYDDVLQEILNSDIEYCLILRPFGHDGRTRLTYGYKPWFIPRGLGLNRYLEQVVTKSARKSCGLKSYALVDSRTELAPPGPIPVRATMARWQFCTEQLLDNAHSIVILLPPDRKFRDGFKWEVQQVWLRSMQKRLMLVIPPAPFESEGYRACIEQAATILAALETFGGGVEDVDPLLVLHWEEELTQSNALVVEICLNGSLEPSPLAAQYWHIPENASPARIGAKFYESILIDIFRGINRYLERVPLDRRYPRVRRID